MTDLYKSTLVAVGDKLFPTFIVKFDKETEGSNKDRKKRKNKADIFRRLSRHPNEKSIFSRNIDTKMLFIRPIDKNLFAINVKLKKKRSLERIGKEPLKNWDVSLGQHFY